MSPVRSLGIVPYNPRIAARDGRVCRASQWYINRALRSCFLLSSSHIPPFRLAVADVDGMLKSQCANRMVLPAPVLCRVLYRRDQPLMCMSRSSSFPLFVGLKTRIRLKFLAHGDNVWRCSVGSKSIPKSIDVRWSGDWGCMGEREKH